jgi:hypothetical protein
MSETMALFDFEMAHRQARFIAIQGNPALRKDAITRTELRTE